MRREAPSSRSPAPAARRGRAARRRYPLDAGCIAGGEPETQSFEGWDAAASLDELAAALSERPPAARLGRRLARVELAETIERSLKKSRTIDLYYEDYTEEGTFKGTMTSIGCGLLVLGLFVMALVGIAEHMDLPYVGSGPTCSVGLGIFLLLQLVMLTSGKKKHGSEVRPSSDGCRASGAALAFAGTGCRRPRLIDSPCE